MSVHCGPFSPVWAASGGQMPPFGFGSNVLDLEGVERYIYDMTVKCSSLAVGATLRRSSGKGRQGEGLQGVQF